ncbi:hypothetical protein HOLleu_02765 [Holothuria leucospilota]|uniref:SMB domain-containing protein n=1 Tax=Holothuria leucospilota TaxID=206669 RepID=A0A9Q1HL21_HOLLE|nr:hypothetical protein HOLleu_02765 [Holothuria leucospilota]
MLGVTSGSAKSEPGFAEYCSSDFECSLICDSYPAASSRCSCHPACRLFGDCCYNHQEYVSSCHLDNGGEILYFDTLRGYKDHFKCTFDTISKDRYWMVSSCPETWYELNQCDDEEDEFSYKVGRLDKGLSSIPVVSLDGITFRNVYCAVCHGKDPTKLTPWSFQAEGCIDTDIFHTNSTLTFREKVEFVVENCEKVAFLPPSNHSHHSFSVIPCRHIEFNVIDRCNNTTIAETIIEGCSTVAAPIETRKSSRLRKSKQHSYHREVLIYIKIFIILGLTWITGFVASITNIEFLWYLFTILTSFQGVFILLAFTLKAQIWNMWGQRLGIITPRQSRAPTSAHRKGSSKKTTITSV